MTVLGIFEEVAPTHQKQYYKQKLILPLPINNFVCIENIAVH